MQLGREWIPSQMRCGARHHSHVVRNATKCKNYVPTTTDQKVRGSNPFGRTFENRWYVTVIALLGESIPIQFHPMGQVECYTANRLVEGPTRGPRGTSPRLRSNGERHNFLGDVNRYRITRCPVSPVGAGHGDVYN